LQDYQGGEGAHHETAGTDAAGGVILPTGHPSASPDALDRTPVCRDLLAGTVLSLTCVGFSPLPQE